ncbi:MAG: 50S ribosomal protein L24 [Deltaproteobacteria bacterium]|nr:MAG: 50S ribosomal protein L24 [Deltaproteobacteria bacterium]RLA98111.1 MAG: 50S ribosomal protein L24 [Deltaproteobacteria bacterium]
MKKLHVKKGDLVLVIAGKDRGKSGKVIRVMPKKEAVIVERLNMVKRHLRPSPTTGKGGIVEKEAPIHVSNVQILCGKCNRPTRVGHRILEDGTKVRVCKKCGEPLDQ